MAVEQKYELPQIPHGYAWDIKVGDGFAVVDLRRGFDYKLVATGGHMAFPKNETESFVAAAVVMLAKKAVIDFDRARSLTKMFGVQVKAC